MSADTVTGIFRFTVAIRTNCPLMEGSGIALAGINEIMAELTHLP